MDFDTGGTTQSKEAVGAWVAMNRKARQLGPKSGREVQRDLAGIGQLLQELAATRRAAEGR